MEYEILDKYIGPKKVAAIAEESFTTPSGGKVFRVTFEDDTTEILPEKTLAILVRDNPIDSTSRREMLFNVIMDEVIKLLMEYDLKAVDVNFLMNKVQDKIQDAFDRASNYLWTGLDKDWVPGMNFINNRTILEAEKVLKGIPRVIDGEAKSEQSGGASDTEGN